MSTTKWRKDLGTLLVVLTGLAAGSPAFAQQARAQGDGVEGARWWLGAGVGGASVNSMAPAPSAGRGAVAASVDFGYRFTPQWGLGFEYGGVVPLGGCADWGCAGNAAAFAPTFTHFSAFGEFRPRQSGWRFRAGAGVSRFCHSRHWSDSAWGWGDTFGALLAAVLDEDFETDPEDGSGGYRCDARMKALGGAVSVGYDWPVSDTAPVAVGLRLTAEAANFGSTPAIGLPAFRHRAVMLTLHLNIN